MNRVITALLACCVPMAGALADDARPPPAGSWSVSTVGGYSDTGQADRGTVSLILPAGGTHFALRLVQSAWPPSSGGRDRVSVEFPGGGHYELVGARQGGTIDASIPDQEMVPWMHDFTAQSTMVIRFPLMVEPAWTVSLSGTAPTVTAMAKALAAAGVTGLPAPWGPPPAPPPASVAAAALPPLPVASGPHQDCIDAGRPMWVNGVMSPDAAAQRQRMCEQGYLDRAAAARREQQARAQQAAADEQARLAAQEAAADRTRQRVAAEGSADNHCKEPKFAGDMIDRLNDLMKTSWKDDKVIDIEHLTTVAWNPDTSDYRCHGVFLTTTGLRRVGTFSLRPNVAGRLLVGWKPDE